ncbi:asparagine synthase (glutamine-hydrolyzing) [Bordetella hinzii]|uniref:asparagine synthase (glutamine-hydrolyzing) n=1 Tax=Bordetella hinzii TaxID=103855 RepID=A0AAN1RV52_9BORD|nr:asparagine synthase (glutamine-hydrolyzing) [Bordetella hinzii]AZW16636.1 asparagine synthetase B [Bordetella hinzii]KCB46165.1 asparagine synthase (glutamine-hydrolyzing) [Bordetella hinzii 4161]KXA73678.1 asparagine synthetase B [Bordetella hinzii LMG 13501]MBZ0074069.1 asparagine synthase (glutamine-hydrolyzing) [Bordetella hinzii]MBZ0081349.1 asparagine synthase (glutamine-hydrolyzing) [Bordetella hinzii]
MCGIAGFINLNGIPAEPELVRRMTDAIVHRGPDGEGQWADGPIALGHRRLAIIDLTVTGAQPMHSVDGRYILTYNGELYNYRELRAELEALGHRFLSTSDTEVLLSALSAWGTAALIRFNGMFAFALWDRREQTLLLARDRYGIKPLYYAQAGGAFAFASEAKAILAHPGFSARMNLPALLEYFTFQNLFTSQTLFEGISMLPAGCWMKIGSQGRSQIERYWDYAFEEPETPRTEEDYLEELDFLFQRAVSRQMVSDVEVGAYLSGGMDSGSVTALASRHQAYMRTFTCGFDMTSASGVELNFDERAAAERMSYLFKTEHYEMVLKAGDMERILPKMAWHLEEPRVGQSYPNFYVAQLASKFNKVVLAGTGGDELFGGYPWRYYRAVVNDDFEHYIDKYYAYWQRLIPNTRIKQVFAPVWNSVGHVWTRDIFRDVFASHASTLTRPEDYVNHSLYLEAKTFLHGLLVIEDKLSMAHSLETRVPFLDNDLVDFAMKLPTNLKLGHLSDVIRLNENDAGQKTARYFQKAKDGKLLLRKMMSRHVPQDVVEREKQGFSAPDASWFKGESINYVRELLHDPNARIYNFLDRASVQTLVDEHLQGKENRRLLIWSLLSVENMCRQYL